MDKLKQIEAFIAVVEHGSMAAAALTQDVTPVMIGRRINALEARLGVKLLHRSTRRIAVTEQGAVFMEQCKKALGELDRAELLVAEGRHKATGHLIVSAPAAFGRKHVAPHAPDFLRANPDVRISFNLTDRVVDLVREGYDVGIRIGGAVELGGLKLPPNFRRSEAMLEKARAFLPGLKPQGGVQWMGFRPSLPDSLPAIGRARATPKVIYAFGHGHLGLTQAAATGRLVRDLFCGKTPAIDLAPFSPQRF